MPHTIENLMLGAHANINRFLREFETLNASDLDKARELFERFKWNLEKHFFLEEKIIFNTFVSIFGEETEHTFELLKDHVEITQLIKKIEKNLPDTSLLEELKTLIKAHVHFEDTVFYPNLDEVLTPMQKKEVIEKTKETILN
jgi:iron-sulfur cluster repair protein YtfE (RIC family)